MYRDWSNLSYLRRGTARQREAYRVLRELDLERVLRDHGPVLAGTVPLAVDVPASDLDVICQVDDLPAFHRLLAAAYGHLPSYRAWVREFDTGASAVALFRFRGFDVEVFGQALPACAQLAVLHMDVEARLLRLAGPPARRWIRVLKQLGMKTEPAFARYFGLEGDPYEALLRLGEQPDEALRAVARRAAGRTRALSVPAFLDGHESPEAALCEMVMRRPVRPLPAK